MLWYYNFIQSFTNMISYYLLLLALKSITFLMYGAIIVVCLSMLDRVWHVDMIALWLVLLVPDYECLSLNYSMLWTVRTCLNLDKSFLETYRLHEMCVSWQDDGSRVIVSDPSRLQMLHKKFQVVQHNLVSSFCLTYTGSPFLYCIRTRLYHATHVMSMLYTGHSI